VAQRLAAELGFPVVMKAIAPGLLHKSDIGGVLLDLYSAQAVERAAVELAQRGADAGHPLTGLLLQRQVEPGLEAFVGMTTDPTLGPLIVSGLGGVQLELMRDVAFRLPPVSDLDADDMLRGLRAAALFDGYRGSTPADRAALIDVISKLSALVELVPELVELDLNPVKLLAPGQGAVVLDGRLRLTPQPSAHSDREPRSMPRSAHVPI
jgi:acetate---CoA ligase (ADP-forming)